MKIEELLHSQTEPALTTTLERPVYDVASVMAEKRIGLIVVLADNGALIGVVSERDVVRAVANWPTYIPDLVVSQIFTEKPRTCGPQDDLVDVIQIMESGGFRHMPVVEHGHLVGVISRDEVYRALLADQALKDRERLMKGSGFY